MIRMSPARRGFLIANYIILTLTGLAMILPFIYIFAGSFSSGHAISAGKVLLWPVEWTLENYKAVTNNKALWRAFGVTLLLTTVGTFINLVFTSLMAYGLARNDLRGRKFILLFIVFSMIFQVPIIPLYLLVKSLGMLNSLWALIIPGTISAFNLIIMITFFQNIPESLTEAAKIDGADEYRTLWKVVLPLSLPSLSTIGLFYAVGHWNGYFSALMFLRNSMLYPLQVKLRALIVESDAESTMQAASLSLQSLEGIKMAAIIVATIPVILIYPFIQKHFIKGAMLGSLKG
ncbi:carbohydrate ABC transporter permease [Bacillus sp. 3255]|uniref:carbohydrate ABC transporter permease n=1 Tax=Bacillus sp. 3255 TaxID=2817904 RepID=UPI002863976A|nr:carbohydrate ABC transporter permease [Bacillus sp. 3255]MDR6881273.1 multiple sugar transport system permease protein/putative aldouronate transport system permease protein [Bacillus sp. 3255]